MGQRINAIGWRTGFHRGWNFTWVMSDFKEWRFFFKKQFNFEGYLQHLLSKVSFRRIIKLVKVWLFSIKTVKAQLTQISLFIFFYKMRTPRRGIIRNYKRQGYRHTLIAKSTVDRYRQVAYLKKFNKAKVYLKDLYLSKARIHLKVRANSKKREKKKYMQI